MGRVSDNAVALIAALSALVGTVVGGVITYEANKALQDRQVRQEEARQATTARAVARLLKAEYENDAGQLEYMIGTEKYISESHYERTFVSRIGLEDRKLMAGRLPEKVWEDISEAAREVGFVEAEVEIHRGKGAVGEAERETFGRARSACDAAAAALAPLAEGKSS